MACWILSRTSCAAMSPFFERSNVTTTWETPSVDRDCSESIPEMVFTAPSILSVTSLSISRGAEPARRVVMTTTGMSTFGYSSTPRVAYPATPNTTSTSMSTAAKTGRLVRGHKKLTPFGHRQLTHLEPSQFHVLPSCPITTAKRT
jgi:hypothetical protein